MSNLDNPNDYFSYQPVEAFYKSKMAANKVCNFWRKATLNPYRTGRNASYCLKDLQVPSRHAHITICATKTCRLSGLG